MRGPAPRLHHGFFENVLGTSLEIQVVVDRRGSVSVAEQRALSEIRRLERIFSVFSAESELRRWCATHDEPVQVSEELATALERAAEWHRITAGAFDPRAEVHTRQWRTRAQDGCPPELGGPSALPTGLDSPLWVVDRRDGQATARKLTPEPISLNAFAKGIIIDRACEVTAALPGVCDALINIGGDIRHIGTRPISVGIAHPFVDAENAPPLATIRLLNGGLATSGSYRRGFEVDGRHRSHIIDPATGEPADAIRSVTTIATTAAEADVLATAFSVLPPARSVEIADSVEGAACFIVQQDGEVVASPAWSDYALHDPVIPPQERP